MCYEIISFIRARFHFHDYEPKPITYTGYKKWLNQFVRKDRKLVLKLLFQLKYYSRADTKKVIVELNNKLLRNLMDDGIPRDKIIYVTVDEPGSSSQIIFGMLRDAAQLEGRGFHFIDSMSITKMREITSELEDGVIIYVDDFSASGNQFCRSRDFVASHVDIIGKFAEFFLLPVICEEAFYEIAERGVQAFPREIHERAGRPFHQISSILEDEIKEKLLGYCNSIDDKYGLGYKNLATMVVFYRNTPNTVPLLFRGDVGQKKWCGIIPRTTDLG